VICYVLYRGTLEAGLIVIHKKKNYEVFVHNFHIILCFKISKTKRDLPWLSRCLVGILYGSHYTTEGIKRDA
jgi:hypothetical protein